MIADRTRGPIVAIATRRGMGAACLTVTGVFGTRVAIVTARSITRSTGPIKTRIAFGTRITVCAWGYISHRRTTVLRVTTVVGARIGIVTTELTESNAITRRATVSGRTGVCVITVIGVRQILAS